MKHKKINFAKLLKGYKKGWVAISSDFKRIIFHGETLKEVRNKTQESKGKIFYFPAGENYSNFVG